MKYIHFLTAALLLFSACDETDRAPIDHDGIAPQQISNVETEALPGGARITYQLPNDPDLLYIEASYTLPNGETRITNSSYNKRSVQVEGFAEIMEYNVALTSVDRSGNRSKPYIVTFTPDTAPVTSIFKSVMMQPDFGGVNLVWTNPTEAEIVLIVSKKDKDGDFVVIDNYYTSAKTGSYTVRGITLDEGEFAVKVRDKWNNISESKTQILTPIYESQLDVKKFSSLGQAYTNSITDWNQLSKLWNNDRDNNVFNGSKYPWYASMKLDEKPVRLSRVVIWQYAWAGSKEYGHYYAGGNGKVYEIYGSNEPTEDMTGWKLLLTCEIVKPSGKPYGFGREYMSDEDFKLAHELGHEFKFPLDTPLYRYLRIRGIDCFEGTLATPSEIDFYGDQRETTN